MSNVTEQLNEVVSTNIETTLRLAKIGLDGVERLTRINLEAARQAVEDNARNAQSLSSVKDAQEAVAVSKKLAEAATQTALGFSRTLYEVFSQTQAELSKLFEERAGAFSRVLVSSVEKASKSAPAGSDVAVAALKSTVAATAAAIDSMTKATKQVADFADASVKAASTATEDAVKTAVKKAS